MYLTLQDLALAEMSDVWSDWSQQRDDILRISEDGRIDQARKLLREASPYFTNRFKSEQPDKLLDFQKDLSEVNLFVGQVQTQGASERLKQTLKEESDLQEGVRQENKDAQEKQLREQCQTMFAQKFGSLGYLLSPMFCSDPRAGDQIADSIKNAMWWLKWGGIATGGIAITAVGLGLYGRFRGR